MITQKKEVLAYFKDKNSGEGFTSDQKKILSQLAKFVKEENYSGYQIAFAELKLYYDLSEHLYDRLSQRSLKNCHPQSLPYIRRKILQQFSSNKRNEMIRGFIEKLPTGDRYELTIRRRKALLFGETGQCDNEGVHTVFGQIWQEMKKNNGSLMSFCVNSVDSQILRVNFSGEGSIDAGGPYRETLTNICKEL